MKHPREISDPTEQTDESTAALNTEDRRGCVRIGQVDGPREGVLHDGMTSRHVTFVNQSAEGFGVRCQLPASWRIDQRLRLNAGGLWHEVKVVYVEEQEDHQQIGLKRLGDCESYGGLSPLRAFWGEFRSMFRVARSFHILGFGSAFLLCLVVLFIVLNPNSPLNGGSRLRGGLTLDPEEESQPPVANPVVPVAQQSDEVSQPVPQDDNNDGKVGMEQRITALLEGSADIAWVDLEQALELTVEQSKQFLALLAGGDASDPLDDVDTSKIVIDSREDFATFLQSLPEKVYAFLDDDQRQALQGMLGRMTQ